MTADRKPPPEIPASRPATRRSDDPISMGLRRLWADVESEAVPDDFLDLLDQIDSRRAEGKADGGADGGGESGSGTGA